MLPSLLTINFELFARLRFYPFSIHVRPADKQRAIF